MNKDGLVGLERFIAVTRTAKLTTVVEVACKYSFLDRNDIAAVDIAFRHDLDSFAE